MTTQDVLAALKAATENSDKMDALIKAALPAQYGDIRQPTQSCDAAIALLNKVLTGWRLETLEQCLDYYSGVESWHCKLRQHRQREFYKAEDTKLHAESNAATPALAVMIAMFEVLVNHPEMAAAFQVAA